MPKFPLEEYAQRVRNVIARNGPDAPILSLLRDKRLKAYDDKLRRRCKVAGQAYDELLRRKQGGGAAASSKTETDAYKSAFNGWRNSPRQKLIAHIRQRFTLTRMLQLALQSKEVQGWLTEDLAQRENVEKQKDSFKQRMRQFKVNHASLYPIPGLQLQFKPDGYYIVHPNEPPKVRTALWLKIDDRLIPGYLRKMFSRISDLRSALIDLDGIPKLDRLPHVLRTVLKQHPIFGGKSKNWEIAKSLNVYLTELITTYVHKQDGVGIGFMNCIDILTIIHGDKDKKVALAIKKAEEEIRNKTRSFRVGMRRKDRRRGNIHQFVTPIQIRNLLQKQNLQ